MIESVVRIKIGCYSRELAKIVANMKSLQDNEQSVGNVSHSNDGGEGLETIEVIPKEEEEGSGLTERLLPSVAEGERSPLVVIIAEEPKIESVEDEERPSTKEIVVNCVSCVFFLMRVMLSVALGVSVFLDPTRIPYGIAVCAVVEPVSMLVQLFAMSNNFAYKLNSITSLSVLLFCFCIAFYQVTDTVYMRFCIVLGIEIAVDMFVIFASGENESSAAAFTTVSLLVFIGGYALYTEGLLTVFGVLLDFWILFICVIACIKEGFVYVEGIVELPLLLAGLQVWTATFSEWLFFITLFVVAYFVASGVSRCGANSDLCISLFAVDLELFLWWCWLTLSSQSVPILSHFFLSVMYGITTGFFLAFGTKANKWRVTILVIISTCLMGCSWISIAINHVTLTIVCDTLNMILFTLYAFIHDESSNEKLVTEERGRKEGKACFRFLLYLVDVALAAVWLWLCIRWMNATKKSPSTPSMLLLIILSSYITLSPLVVLVATVFRDAVYYVIRLFLYVTVFGCCARAVQFSTRFTPFLFFGGALLFLQVGCLLCVCGDAPQNSVNND